MLSSKTHIDVIKKVEEVFGFDVATLAQVVGIVEGADKEVLYRFGMSIIATMMVKGKIVIREVREE